jgi:hypothetical protein
MTNHPTSQYHINLNQIFLNQKKTCTSHLSMKPHLLSFPVLPLNYCGWFGRLLILKKIIAGGDWTSNKIITRDGGGKSGFFFFFRLYDQ